jgi:hypothetical protein
VAREDAPRVDVPPREDAALEGAADADEAAAVGRRPSMDKLGESSWAGGPLFGGFAGS